MLLEFKAENYRSFKDEFIFSMIPAPKKRDLVYSILKKKINNKEYSALCSSVIYGPNAAGKSNIIGALDTLQSIIKKGHIKDSSKNSSSNIASERLNLIPNNKLTKPKDVNFSIEFINDNHIIKYKLSINLGLFLDTDYPRKITKEELYVNNDLIFSRDNSIKIGENKTCKRYLLNLVRPDNIDSISENLQNEELFLCNGFKTIFAKKLTEPILSWFNDKLSIIYSSHDYEPYLAPLNSKNYKLHEYINRLARSIGINSNMICFLSKNNEQVPHLYSLFKGKDNGIIAEAIESYGTIRLIHMLIPLIDALVNGNTLIIDEFDASLHPMVVMSIINVFHNEEINKNSAQLIFNTHNPIFLNSNLFRRDEIKFVDREDNEYSILYSLADFKTSGKNSVRNTTDYMKNYFINRYGAIKDIDFSTLFETVVSDSNLYIKRGN